MKKQVIFTTLLFYTLSCCAQTFNVEAVEPDKIFVADEINLLDSCKIRIQYWMTYIDDLNDRSQRKEYFMTLQIGKKISKFSDSMRLKVDSLQTAYASRKMMFTDVVNKTSSLVNGTSTLNVFKNYPESNKITVSERVPFSGYFKYIEDKPLFKWEIKDDTISVCGYRCQKATTSFRGRHYTAWFTSEIPVSDGPWKFHGLPGLILKISDDNNEIQFICAGIEKATNISNGIYMKNLEYYKTTRDKLKNITTRFYENSEAFMNSSGVSVDSKPITASNSKKYNPIELE